jgi:lysophospholipase L1-like esterase
MMDSLFEEVYTRVEANLELNANPRFVNASNLLDGAEDVAFWDAIHTTEAGNALIAARIAEDLREVLQ